MLILKICDELTDKEKSLGVRRVPPTWGAKMDAGEYFRHIAPGLTKGLDPLTPAELGCTLSHLECYSIIIRERRSALILEDDISLDDQSLKTVKHIAELGLEFTHLAQSSVFTFRGQEIDDGLYKIDPRMDFWGSAAYLVTPEFAQEVQEFHTPFVRFADAWTDFFQKRAGDSPHFSPIFFHTGETSAIQTSREMARKLSAKALLRRRALQWGNRQMSRFPDWVQGLPPPVPRISKEWKELS
ncbi:MULTISPECIES: glycosyltransferase family 25 protein [Falsihalocynthiibacter]|uniref:glycosyltransferase family 25 protein n=1 Tax=Falsihalocynthiibacter TaxID=2854182 RepID=UPI003001D80D